MKVGVCKGWLELLQLQFRQSTFLFLYITNNHTYCYHFWINCICYLLQVLFSITRCLSFQYVTYLCYTKARPLSFHFSDLKCISALVLLYLFPLFFLFTSENTHGYFIYCFSMLAVYASFTSAVIKPCVFRNVTDVCTGDMS